MQGWGGEGSGVGGKWGGEGSGSGVGVGEVGWGGKCGGVGETEGTVHKVDGRGS